MPFNRINGFYAGGWSTQESKAMTLDERNQEVNLAQDARFVQLNSAFEAHEAELKQVRVTQDTSIIYQSSEVWDDAENCPGGCYNFYLGMRKLRGGWRLCHASCYESFYGGPDDGIDWTPIVEASIEDRLRAAPHVDKLRAAIVESKEKLVPKMDEAITALASKLKRP